MDYLSPNFTLQEMIRSQTGERLEIDNEPSYDVIERLRNTCAQLERVRTVVGGPLFISSGYRSPAVNKAVGGVAGSQHLTGEAADIVAGIDPYSLCMLIASHQAIVFDQLIYEWSWTHISFVQPVSKSRRQTLTLLPGGGYANGIVRK